MTVALDASYHKFLEDLKATPFGHQIEQEAHKSATEKRESIAARIAAIRAEQAEKRPMNVAARQAAYDKAVAAEAVFREAERALAVACYNHDAGERLWCHLIDMCEAELRATSSAEAEIKKFISSMSNELDRKIDVQLKTGKGIYRGGLTDFVPIITNIDSIRAHKAACLVAIKQAEELALLPDQSEVSARLEEIRSKIPKVQDV